METEPEEEELRVAFQTFDENGDGFITAEGSISFKLFLFSFLSLYYD